MIRPARAEDAPALAAIYAHHVLHGEASFDFDPPSPAHFAAKIAECAGRGWPFLVDGAGGVAGYAYATQIRDRPGYAWTCEGSVYVRPDCLGQGIGARLLAALIDACTARGFRQMVAVVGGGAPASVALHARAGFAEVGRIRAAGRKFDRWLDTVYMQRALGDGDATPPK